MPLHRTSRDTERARALPLELSTLELKEFLFGLESLRVSSLALEGRNERERCAARTAGGRKGRRRTGDSVAGSTEMVSRCGRTERCYIQIRVDDGMRT